MPDQTAVLNGRPPHAKLGIAGGPHLCNHHCRQGRQKVHQAQAPAAAQPAHEQRRSAGGGAQGGEGKGQQVELRGVGGGAAWWWLHGGGLTSQRASSMVSSDRNEFRPFFQLAVRAGRAPKIPHSFTKPTWVSSRLLILKMMDSRHAPANESSVVVHTASIQHLRMSSRVAR